MSDPIDQTGQTAANAAPVPTPTYQPDDGQDQTAAAVHDGQDTRQPSPAELVEWPLTPADAKRVLHVLRNNRLMEAAPVDDLIGSLTAALDAVPM